MRKLLLSFFITFVYCISNAQPVSKVENHFADLIERVGYWGGNYENEDRYDSLKIANEKAFNYILEAASTIPATLTVPFARFDSIWRTGILTSEDGKVRIYDWDDYQGGTMRSYNSIIQYKSTSGVKAEKLCADIEDTVVTFCPSFSSLHALQVNGATVYTLVKTYLYSSTMGAQEVVAFKIDNDTLKWGIPIFKTTKQLLSSISFEFERFKAIDEKFGDRCFVEWDNPNHTFYIPVINDKNYMTGKYFRYKFDGNYFTYDKIVNGSGLNDN